MFSTCILNTQFLDNRFLPLSCHLSTALEEPEEQFGRPDKRLQGEIMSQLNGLGAARYLCKGLDVLFFLSATIKPSTHMNAALFHRKRIKTPRKVLSFCVK